MCRQYGLMFPFTPRRSQLFLLSGVNEDGGERGSGKRPVHSRRTDGENILTQIDKGKQSFTSVTRLFFPACKKEREGFFCVFILFYFSLDDAVSLLVSGSGKALDNETH